jgi:hypothetical protein
MAGEWGLEERMKELKKAAEGLLSEWEEYRLRLPKFDHAANNEGRVMDVVMEDSAPEPRRRLPT